LFAIRSLAYRTDLILLACGGELIDRGDYIVVRSPQNPHYWWGNFLLWRRPPAAGDLERWRERFAAELPGARHMTFGWDAPDGATGELAPFVAAGFAVARAIVLTARALTPPRPSAAPLTIRPLHSDDDWQQATANQLRCADHPAVDAELVNAQMRRYRALAASGLGAWHGAFSDGRLVGDLGLYGDGGVGRFQNVETHPDFRRRGVCQTLVYEVSRRALASGIATLVMVADPDYHAARIYESLGFRAAEEQLGLELAPPAA
jgi:ribosomal protein S18 acetylase RimI-like enzyme